MSPHEESQRRKDRPSTWTKYFEGKCSSCWGSCCTLPVEVRFSDLVRLGILTDEDVVNKKLIKRLIKEKIISSYRESTELFTLKQQANDDCLYLDSKTRLCKVYDKRPDVCRKFPSIGPRPGFCAYIKK